MTAPNTNNTPLKHSTLNFEHQTSNIKRETLNMKHKS